VRALVRTWHAGLLVLVVGAGCYPEGEHVGLDRGGDPGAADAGAGDSGSGVITFDTGAGGVPAPDAGVEDAIGEGIDAGEPDSGAGTDPDPTWPDEWVALEDEVLRLVNERRSAPATCGEERFGAAGPLVAQPELRAAARLHALDMGERGYFNHVGLEPRTEPWDRTAAQGYRGGAQGENIAAGISSAREVVRGWMDSPGHCSNIMEPSFRALGVGYAEVPGSPYRSYWVQNFGDRP
jgi:uncharacterized protein YkwD